MEREQITFARGCEKLVLAAVDVAQMVEAPHPPLLFRFPIVCSQLSTFPRFPLDLFHLYSPTRVAFFFPPDYKCITDLFTFCVSVLK